MNLPDLTTATKAQLAEVLASLDVRLTASQVKKASRDELLAVIEAQAKPSHHDLDMDPTPAFGDDTGTRELNCDEPNGIPERVLNPLTAEVRAHAVANYEKGGWDVIVECWSDNEIAEAIVGAKTLAGAIRKLAPTVSIFREQQNEARSEREDAPKKPTHRKPGTTTVTPRGEVKAFKPGTIQAQVADMLRSGATMGDLRRICIRKDGKVWKDSAIKGLFTLDIRSKGYGVRTERHNGFQLWQNCSWDDLTSFTAAMQALNLGHPDDHQDHEAILATAIEIGFDQTELHAVYFLVDPTATE